MRSRWQVGLVALVALMGIALHACVVVPAHPVHYYGYGGSGPYYGYPYSYSVDPRVARAACLHQAHAVRGYPRIEAGNVAQTSPETARVRLYAWGPYTHYEFNCTYNARTGYAYVP